MEAMHARLGRGGRKGVIKARERFVLCVFFNVELQSKRPFVDGDVVVVAVVCWAYFFVRLDGRDGGRGTLHRARRHAEAPVVPLRMESRGGSSGACFVAVTASLALLASSFTTDQPIEGLLLAESVLTSNVGLVLHY